MILEPIPGHCVVDTEGCRRNVDSALRRGLRVCGWAPKRTGTLAIVGSAPSVKRYVDELKAWPGEIWAVNGAYRFLLDHGIVAHAFVGLDPVPELKEYVERRHERTTFLMSSVCDPSVFDELKDADLWLWHSKQNDFPYPPGEQVVGGGTTCLTRAPFLAHMVGWRDITLYGGDSSFEEGEYCYRTGSFSQDTDRPKFEVEIGGKVFLTEMNLLKQVPVFGVMETMFNGVLKFKCGGLLEAYLASPVMQFKEDVTIASAA